MACSINKHITICGPGMDDFFIRRSKMGIWVLIMAQEWHDPELILWQSDNESEYKFRKRAEKHLGWKPLTYREFIKRRKK